MKDTIIVAKLIDYDQIRLTMFYDSPLGPVKPSLVIDGTSIRHPLSVLRLTSTSNLSVYELSLEKPLELGYPYFIEIPGLGRIPLDVNEAVTFKDFDKRYVYEGELGAIYKGKKTTFRVYAPLASGVVLRLRKPGSGNWTYYPMSRLSVGVYELEVEGNVQGYLYNYLVTNSGSTSVCVDPYALASSANGKESVVVDFSKITPPKHYECLPVLNANSDAVIYETSVRDFTIHPSTDIKHKGKYLGLTERGRKTKKGHPAGLDYLKELGITHLQILPMYDFETVDELHPLDSYNWGYDPAQYFVPEGSYATDPEDPLSRIKECIAMVDALHKEGIRVVMDVVYNHVHSYEGSVYEKIVPGYYFRHRPNGRMANTSGCGDDLASERPMVRRLIVDSALHWIEHYGVDGFRFDLMGIIDCETLNEIYRKAKKLKKDFIAYGEGWNMGGEVDFPLGTMGNYALLPEYGFFNDFFRESIKGLCFGDDSKRPAAMFALLGSCVDYNRPPMFDTALRSINYVECHDNGTFYDYLNRFRGDLSHEDILKLVELGLSFTLFGLGIPFIHAGQEIGGTKKGEDNTYNLPDSYNQFDYDLLDERYHMVEFAKKAVALRRNRRMLRVYDPSLIYRIFEVVDQKGAILLYNSDSNLTAPEKENVALFNPQRIPVSIDFPQAPRVLLSSDESIRLEGSQVTLCGFGFAFLSL